MPLIATALVLWSGIASIAAVRHVRRRRIRAADFRRSFLSGRPNAAIARQPLNFVDPATVKAQISVSAYDTSSVVASVGACCR